MCVPAKPPKSHFLPSKARIWGGQVDAAEPHVPTAVFYLSLLAADLAQPQGTFLGSNSFYPTLGANFLKQRERKKFLKKKKKF